MWHGKTKREKGVTEMSTCCAFCSNFPRPSMISINLSQLFYHDIPPDLITIFLLSQLSQLSYPAFSLLASTDPKLLLPNLLASQRNEANATRPALTTKSPPSRTPRGREIGRAGHHDQTTRFGRWAKQQIFFRGWQRQRWGWVQERRI